MLRRRDRVLRRGGVDMDLMAAPLIAETTMLLGRSCWDHGAELADAGETLNPVQPYCQYRQGRRLVLT